MSPSKTSPRNWIEGLLYGLEVLLQLGLVSGAALAAALGQVLLGLVFAAVCLGVFLRIWRGRRRMQPQKGDN